jgi:hypothetical protein
MTIPINAVVYFTDVVPIVDGQSYSVTNAKYLDKTFLSNVYSIDITNTNIHIPAFDAENGIIISGVINRFKITNLITVDTETFHGEIELDQTTPMVGTIFTGGYSYIGNKSNNLKLSAVFSETLYSELPQGLFATVLNTDLFETLDSIPTDKNYVHDQTLASSNWILNHNLNKFPAVSVADSTGDTVEGSVMYNGLNSLTIKFSAPFAGKAYLN